MIAQKGARHIYQQGQKVAHPSHGGCVVKGICDRTFKGETTQYYILIPQSDPNTTILDPVKNAQRIGLRDIMSSEQADQVFAFAAQAETTWIRDNAQRRAQQAEILKWGDARALTKMIKTLMFHAADARLSMHDKTMLRSAQKKLLSEIALAKDIPFEAAEAMLNDAVQSAGQAAYDNRFQA